MPSYIVLARKYRPTVFSEVIGQSHVIKTLTNAISSGRVAHAFLFCGVRGVGKTTVARILAKSLNCSGRDASDPEPCNRCSSCIEINKGAGMDVQEIDGASHTSVDNIREINENIKYPPAGSLYRIIIIDEVHMISVNAFNALLKTLEEPPAHVKFIFATTEAHKVPATINSRCQRFNFRTISLREIISGMTLILGREGIIASEEALALIGREAQGSFRDALSLLDQVAAFGSQKVSEEDVLAVLGVSSRAGLGGLASAILNRQVHECFEILDKLFQEGCDPEQFLVDFIHYVRNILIVKNIPARSRLDGMVDVPPSELTELDHLAGRSSSEQLLGLLSLLLKSEGEIRKAANPWIFLEMSMMRMIHAPDVVNLKQIVERIDAKIGNQHPTTLSEDHGKIQRSPGQDDSQSRKTVSQATNSEKPISVKDHFTITGIAPMASGTADEVWSELRDRLTALGVDRFIASVMEHGSLISFSPRKVEIGFHKGFYSQEFENRLRNKPEVREVFNEFFGGAEIKVLTLASKTTLENPKPYDAPSDGQSDLDRALKTEALESPITKALLNEFEDAIIEDIRVISSKG